MHRSGALYAPTYRLQVKNLHGAVGGGAARLVDIIAAHAADGISKRAVDGMHCALMYPIEIPNRHVPLLVTADNDIILQGIERRQMSHYLDGGFHIVPARRRDRNPSHLPKPSPNPSASARMWPARGR